MYLGITIQKPKNIIVYENYIQILSINKKVIEYFTQEFGGSFREKQQILNHKIPYVWTIKGIKSLEIAKQIKDNLLDKKIACGIYIQFSETIKPNSFKVIDENIINIRKNLINEIRKEKHMNDFVTKELIDALKERKQSIIPQEINYPYMAGLIDAEGCFRIKKWKPKDKPNYVYTICLEIGNTRYPIFPWLIDRFGGSIVFYHPKTNKKPAAIWSLSANKLSKFLPKVYPYLRVKKEVCAKLIEFCETILPNGGDRHSREFKELYNAIITKREIIVDEIHKLNAKGIHIS